MSFQASSNLSDHLIHFPDRPLVASMNWSWNQAVVLLCQEQHRGMYGSGPTPNVGGFTSWFTAVLGEIAVPVGDDGALLQMLRGWLDAHRQAGWLEIHRDSPPGQSDESGRLDQQLTAAGLSTRGRLVSSERRARRTAVREMIDVFLNEGMLVTRLVVHPTQAPGLANELRLLFDPANSPKDRRDLLKRSYPYVDALAPFIEHQFSPGRRAVVVDF